MKFNDLGCGLDALKQQLANWLALDTISIERIGGGQNNFAFKLIADGKIFFLKQVPLNSPGAKDRLAKEVAFQKLLKKQNVNSYIRLMDANELAGLLLFEWSEGCAVSRVNESMVEQALDFVESINADLPQYILDQLPLASDCALSMADFFIGIEKRILAFQTSADACQQVISKQIVPIVDELRSICQKYADDNVKLGNIVSPSDFGFHNALLSSDNRVSFHDFEYAGKDSAVKMLLDFWAQPRVPIDIAHFQLLKSRTLFQEICLPQRVWISLFQLTVIKWTLIKLNVFIEERGALKAEVMGCALQVLRANRLEEATADLQSLPQKAKKFRIILEEIMGN